MSATPRAEHFPLFDSLRGIGCLMVFAAHSLWIPARETYGPAEWWWRYAAHLEVAVPVFFALSGFLLYRPYVSARARGRRTPSAKRYFVRRALRILPAYWVALAVVTLWYDKPEVQGLEGALRYGLFLQIYDPDSAILGLAQAWTLDVEVVFYALLPLWALAMVRFGRSEYWAIGGLIVASMAWKAFALTQADPANIRDLPWLLPLPTWLDHFAIGMGLAVLSVRDPGWRWLRRRPGVPWALAGVIWLATCVLGSDGSNTDPVTDGEYLLKHAAYTVILFLIMLPAAFGDPREGALRRFLAWRPLALMGTISLSFYLFHLAVIGQVYLWWGGLPASNSAWAAFALLTLAGSIGLGAIGYLLLERPFINLGRMRRSAQAHAAP